MHRRLTHEHFQSQVCDGSLAPSEAEPRHRLRIRSRRTDLLACRVSPKPWLGKRTTSPCPYHFADVPQGPLFFENPKMLFQCIQWWKILFLNPPKIGSTPITACVQDCVQCSTFYADEQTSIWPSKARSDSDNGRNQTAGFFPAATSICVIALELPRLVAPDVPTISHVKEMLLLPDSKSAL